ncbi:ribonuclease H-like domain-containing protein [Tanacetum coccineum]
MQTPVDTESKLGSDGDPVSDPTLYRSLAGALQYLTFTCPDISYAVQHICLYMHDPRDPHFTALKRILRYVRGTIDHGLQLYCNTPQKSGQRSGMTSWTIEEEIALAKGWLAISKNNKHGNSRRQTSFWYESGEASINLNTNVGDNDEDDVQEIRRPGGKDKARAARNNKWSKASGSSSVNEDALARSMVTEMTAQEKEQREKFLELKMREVECREREIAIQEYRQE